MALRNSQSFVRRRRRRRFILIQIQSPVICMTHIISLNTYLKRYDIVSKFSYCPWFILYASPTEHAQNYLPRQPNITRASAGILRVIYFGSSGPSYWKKKKNAKNGNLIVNKFADGQRLETIIVFSSDWSIYHIYNIVINHNSQCHSIFSYAIRMLTVIYIPSTLPGRPSRRARGCISSHMAWQSFTQSLMHGR